MKKKLLSLAVAAALPLAAQAANAEVTIYGKIHASVDFLSPDVGDSITDVTSRASRIGFKGSEDLGNGLKMIWKVETGVNIAEGGGEWASRNAYIGLAGGWGTFLYGRHDTPVKMSTGKLDIFGDTIADYNLGSQNG
ncbi:MAG TPA: porin, partial [Chromatiaceae bacterium]|nr:porin [Chromatiaceae bacterium]